MLTLFPEMFPGPLGTSLAGQALDAGIWSLNAIQIRDFGIGKHRQVDDSPTGGGARPDLSKGDAADMLAELKRLRLL